MALLLPGLPRAAQVYTQWRQEGMGYHTRRFQASGARQVIAGLDGPLYTDEPEVVHFFTGRLMERVPRRDEMWSDRSRFNDEVAALREATRDGGYLVVQRFRRTDELEDEIKARLPSAELIFGVYRLPPAG